MNYLCKSLDHTMVQVNKLSMKLKAASPSE